MNRDLVEVIFKNLFVNSLIIRLPVIFNHDQKRGILYDILNSKKIYLSKNTTIIIPEHFIPSFKPAKTFVNKVKDKVKKL